MLAGCFITLVRQGPKGPKGKRIDGLAGWLAGDWDNESGFVALRRYFSANKVCTGRMHAGKRNVKPVSPSWLLRTALFSNMRQLRIGDVEGCCCTN